jgi:hypothetical protein
MHVDTRYLNWGVFFIVAGAIPLAVQQGLLTAETVADWWRFWPLLIIAAGLGLLLRQTPVAFLGGVLLAGIFGVMVGGVITAGTSLDLGSIACGDTKSTTAFTTQTGTLAGSASVELEFDCGDLTLGTAAGSTWTVAGTSHDGESPIVDASAGRLLVRSRDKDVSVPPFTENREDWQVTLPADVAMSVSTTLNAGSARLDLSGSGVESISSTVNAGSLDIDLGGTGVRRLSLTVNAGSGTIDFPEADVNGSMTVNAGSIEFCVPESVGLQITTNDSFIASNNFDERDLSKSGSTWQSSNWATATNRIDLSATANAGSLELNPEDGCK